MNLKQVLCILLANWSAVFAMDLVHLKRMIDLIQRRLGSSRKALYIVQHPGHSLLKPTNDTLESSVKYPHKNLANLVYGNLKNLGITYNTTNERISYSGFRRDTGLLDNLFRPKHQSKIRNGLNALPTIILVKNVRKLPKNIRNYENIYADNQVNNKLVPNFDRGQVGDDSNEKENDAREILDMVNSSPDQNEIFETRRKTEFKHKNRKELYETDEENSESSSSSSDHEKNPGNPFTVHKNRYKQNWLWNHEMTGDHMNINPKAPVFSNLGPTGGELFFGRKWWYYNQDDYVPFR